MSTTASQPGPAHGPHSSSQNTWAWRLLLAGGVLFSLGLIVSLLADGLEDGWGVTFMLFASLPTAVGLVMLLLSYVARRPRNDI